MAAVDQRGRLEILMRAALATRPTSGVAWVAGSLFCTAHQPRQMNHPQPEGQRGSSQVIGIGSMARQSDLISAPASRDSIGSTGRLATSLARFDLLALPPVRLGQGLDKESINTSELG